MHDRAEEDEDLRRFEKLDDLLGDAVPEQWTADMTASVLAGLDLAPTTTARAAHRTTGALTAAAAAVLLVIWGGPVMTGLDVGGAWLASSIAGILDTVTTRPSFVPMVPAATATAGAFLLLALALTAGFVGARRPGRVDIHA
jgi:hypothetical protein